MRKTDINRYAKEGKSTAGSTFAGIMCAVGGVLKRIFLTLFFVCMITGVIVSISVVSFIYSMKDESIDYDLNKLKLNYTSFIYVNGEGDDPTIRWNTRLSTVGKIVCGSILRRYRKT